MTKLKEKIVSSLATLMEKLRTWYRKSKVKTVIDKILHGIAVGFSFVFYPFVKLYNKQPFRRQKVIVSLLFLSPVIIGFLFFYLYPLIMSLIYAVSEVKIGSVSGIDFTFLKRSEGGKLIFDPLQNFYYTFRVDVNFTNSLLNTVGSTAINTVVVTIFSLLMAVLLNGEYKGRTFIRAVFFLPVIFNSAAIDVAMAGVDAIDGLLSSLTSGVLQAVFNLDMFLGQIGIPTQMISFLNSITGAIYSTISYSGVQILIFLAAIQSVPKHLYEAAKIEGATSYEMFWKITLPIVSPMIMTVVVYSIIDSFLRSEINTLIDNKYKSSDFGIHAAMSWSYIIASVVIVAVFIGLLSMVVFYQDEKN